MLFVYLNEVYSSIENDSARKLMEWENKMKPEILKTENVKSTNPNEPSKNSLTTPKEDNKSLNTVDSQLEETSFSDKNQKSPSDNTVDEETNKHNISKDDNKNVTDQQTNFGDLVYRDYNQPTSYPETSIGNPFLNMQAQMKFLINENGQMRSVPRIRNRKDEIEEIRDRERLSKIAKLHKTFLTDEVDYDGGFPGEYVLSSLDDISPFENTESLKSRKLFVPKNWRSIQTRRLPQETFAENLPKFSKSLSTKTPKSFNEDESEMSDITEDNETDKIVDNKKTEVLKKGENEKPHEFKQKEQHQNENKTKKEVVDAKKETVREAEKLEEKIKEAKEESKKEDQDTKMTEIFNKKSQTNKPISMSLPTSLETPEISRNLFDNNKSTNTVDTEKESGLNKKLIIEQINESEKQLVEIEDLTKNVKANLNKLKEELQAKKDDQRNIELNIIEVKEKTPEK